MADGAITTGRVRRGLAAVALMALVVSGWPAVEPAGADPDSTPQETWVTNGRVRAMVRTGRRIYLGGSFTQVGPNTGHGVAVDNSAGNRNTAFPKVDGVVYAAVPDGDGGWFIGGDFGNVGSNFRKNVAQVTATGSVTSWTPKVDGIVRAIAYSPVRDEVFLGGDIVAVDGIGRAGLASVTGRRGDLTAWNPGAGASVGALAVSPDGTIVYAGGDFTTVDGAARDHLAAVDAATGTATAWNPGADAAVDALALSPDGATVYAGGDFGTAGGGAARNHLAAVDAATGTATGWNPGADAAVHALAVSPDGATVYAGGEFSSAGGMGTAGLAALDASTGTAANWGNGIAGCPQVVPSDPPCRLGVHALSLTPVGDTLFVGGFFTSLFGTGRNHTAAVNTATGAVRAWDPAANTTVRALAAAGSQVFAGGDLTSVNAPTRLGVAALDATTGVLDTGFRADADNHVESLAVSPDGTRLYVGGEFDHIGGTTRNRVAAVDTGSGAVAGWNPVVGGGAVLALAASGSRVVLGGTFAKVGGADLPNLASVDAGTGAAATGWRPNPDGWVGVLTVAPGGTTVYAGGDFNAIGGQGQRKLAGVRLSDGSVTAWSPTVTYPVMTAVVSSSGARLYVGGEGGGSNGNRASAYDTTRDGSPLWETSGGDGNVQAVGLSPAEDVLYVGGHFATMNGVPRQHFLTVSTADGSLTAWAPSFNTALGVWSLLVAPDAVFVGGDFTLAAGRIQQGFARFPVAASVAVTSGPADGSSTNTARPAYAGTATAGGGVARVEVSVDGGAFAAVSCSGCGTGKVSVSWSYTPATALADGAHTFDFRMVDDAGVRSDTVRRTVITDVTAPTVTLASGPANGAIINDSTPTYGGTATDIGAGAVARVEAAVDGGAFATTGVACTGCGTTAATWTFTTASLAQGAHTVAVRATDAVGWVSAVASRTFTLDVTPPTFTSITASAGNSTVGTAFTEPLLCSTVSTGDFAVKVGGTARTVSAVSCAAPASATPTLTLASAPAGDTTVAVTLQGSVTDAAGNAAATPTTRNTFLDVSPPSVTFTSGPADGALVNTARPAYGGSSSDNGTGVTAAEASVDGAAFGGTGVSCTGCGTGASPVTWSWTPPALSDGPHTVAVRARDGAGNTSAGTTRRVSVDTVTPTLAGLAASGGTATVLVSASESLDCASVAASDFAVTVGGRAVAVQVAGCAGAASADVTLTLASATNGGATVALTLTGSVNDPAGNRATGWTASVVASNLPPVLAVTGGPAAGAVVAVALPSYSGTASDADGSVARVEVSTDGGPWGTGGVTCTGCGTTATTLTWTYTPPTGAPLADGAHSLSFRSVDGTGAVSATTTRTVTVDTTAPTVAVTTGPADAVIATAVTSFAGSAGDATTVVSRVEVSTDGGPWGSAGVTCTGCGTKSATWTYTTPATAPLADGSHGLSFRSVDGNGWLSAAVTRSFTVDTTAPVLGLAAASGSGLLATATTTFSGSADDATPVARIEAAVDGGAYTSAGITCTGCGTRSADWTYTSPALRDGRHSVSFRAVDSAGWPSASAQRIVTIDTTAPAVAVTAGPAAGSLVEELTPAFAGSAADATSAVVRVEVLVDGISVAGAALSCTGCGGPSATWTFRSAPLAEGAHTVTVRSVDAAGNVSAAASRTVIVAGYQLATASGEVFSFGGRAAQGSVSGPPAKPVVAGAHLRGGHGYWLVASDGGIFSFGDAAFYGSTGGTPLNKPIVGMAATPSGGGYWLVASDGGIFSFGDAAFYGSTGGTPLNKPIVGMAATPSGRGYWLVASDGGIFSFGDATFRGSTGAMVLNKPIVGLTPTPGGAGYWLVASDGGIFSFGDALFHGSTGGLQLNEQIVGMAATPTGAGYWFVAADGGIFSFGDAAFAGAPAGLSGGRRAVAVF